MHKEKKKEKNSNVKIRNCRDVPRATLQQQSRTGATCRALLLKYKKPQWTFTIIIIVSIVINIIFIGVMDCCVGVDILHKDIQGWRHGFVNPTSNQISWSQDSRLCRLCRPQGSFRPGFDAFLVFKLRPHHQTLSTKSPKPSVSSLFLNECLRIVSSPSMIRKKYGSRFDINVNASRFSFVT